LTVWSRGEPGVQNIPNACNGCHNDGSKGETPEWAVEKIRQWYPGRIAPPHFAFAIAAGRQGKPKGQRLLKSLLARKELNPMVRASGLSLLGRYPHETGQPEAVEALEDPEELVRLAAVRCLGGVHDPARLHELLAPRLRDPIRAVRIEAARLLSRLPVAEFKPGEREAFDAAAGEYVTGQQFLAEQPGAHLNLGYLYTNLGKPDQAVAEYRTALRLDPEFVEGHINLGMLLAERGERDEAMAHYRRALEIRRETIEANRRARERYRRHGDEVQAEQQRRAVESITTELGEIHYSLGLLLAEKPDGLEQALDHLAEAARLAGQNPRVHYNYGLALQKLGRMDEAETSLKRAYRMAPRAPDHLHALAILYVQHRRWQAAAACTKELVRRWPEVGEFQRLHYLATSRAEAQP
jgi:tetratricopeptide (TPR) repeat protein